MCGAVGAAVAVAMLQGQDHAGPERSPLPDAQSVEDLTALLTSAGER